MTNIYILRLKGGKFYVGKSDNPMKRYKEHLTGSGSAWTRKYKPLAVERIIENASAFDEDKYTKEMMAKHGVENVRGGSYVAEVLDEVQEEALLREIWGAKDCCTQCGRPGHFVASCKAQTDVLGNLLYPVHKTQSYYKYATRPIQKKKKQISCYRCGYSGHFADDCRAMKDKKGRYLKSNDYSDSDSESYDSDESDESDY